MTVITGKKSIEAGFRKSGQGKPLIVLSGLPQQSEAITPERARDLAERLYEIARLAELDKMPAVTLAY